MPAGSYTLQASGEEIPTSASFVILLCALHVDALGNDLAPVARDGYNTTDGQRTYSLTNAITLTSTSAVELQCNSDAVGGSGQANGSLVATRIGALH